MASITEINQENPSTFGQPLEFLTFKLGAEEYGIDIQKVQELRGYDAVTRIAGAPGFVKGVVHLRGTVIPIIDMRVRLSIADPAYDRFTVVIVVNLTDSIVGMVVDGVSDVVRLTHEEIKPGPQVGTCSGPGYLIGIGTLGQRMLVLVDAERFIWNADIDTAKAA